MGGFLLKSLFGAVDDAAAAAVGRVAHGRHDLGLVRVALGDDQFEPGIRAIEMVADGGGLLEKMVEGIFFAHAEGSCENGEVFFLGSQGVFLWSEKKNRENKRKRGKIEQ